VTVSDRRLDPLVMFGSAVALLSGLLPWQTLGLISRSGFDNPDGQIVAGLALLGVLIAFGKHGYGRGLSHIALGGIIVWVAWTDIQTITKQAEGGSALSLAVEPGIGIKAALVGGGLMILMGLRDCGRVSGSMSTEMTQQTKWILRGLAILVSSIAIGVFVGRLYLESKQK
jgi:hypothetical protein